MKEILTNLEDVSGKFKSVHIDNGFVFIKVGKYTAKIKIPFRVSKELASLYGHVLGDGHIKKDEQHFHYVNKNKDLIEEVKSEVKNIFAVETMEYFRENKQIYDLNFPVVIAKLLVLLGFPKGRKSIQILSIPEWLKNESVDIKAAFIRALFDDEAWVEIKQGGFCIGFGQNKNVNLLQYHKNYIEEIRNILSQLGVNSSKIFQKSQKGDSIQLGFKILGLQNLTNFNSKIGFLSENKQKRLEFVLNNFKQIQFGKKEAKLKILEKLNVPMKSKELAFLLNRDQKTIWKHLHQLHRKNLVTKIGTKNKVFWKSV
ncbi:MAG: hypothetical protein J4452_01655 [Candidatus Aenigmarchaeota archaeon]|nr:hypothetical protein [Candidatus Aenigmarchaeota archaeon]